LNCRAEHREGEGKGGDRGRKKKRGGEKREDGNRRVKPEAAIRYRFVAVYFISSSLLCQNVTRLPTKKARKKEGREGGKRKGGK